MARPHFQGVGMVSVAIHCDVTKGPLCLGSREDPSLASMP